LPSCTKDAERAYSTVSSTAGEVLLVGFESSEKAEFTL
jgi:hypothetical protein